MNSHPPMRYLSWLAVFVACAGVAAKAAPDITSVEPDLRVPEISDSPPGPGKRVRLELFADTPPVVLYLPTDWSPEKQFPVIIELAGNGNYRNAFGDISTGRPEDSRLGYGLTGGQGFVWACLPFLDESGNEVAITWWGDAPAHRPDSTVSFIKRVVPLLCERFSGDPERVILAGFSRGAIAANAIGLHDDSISGLWRAFICHSHYDGVRTDWPFAGADTARRRLARLRGRPQLICHESDADTPNLQSTRDYLNSTGIAGDFTFLETGFRNHSDAWVLRPSTARRTGRKWLAEVAADPAKGTIDPDGETP